MYIFFQKVPQHIWIAISSVISKVIGALTQIVIVKYLLSELGATGFSTYTLLAALLAWSVLVDFGIGNSLQNFISERRAKKKNYELYILSSFIFLTPAILLLLCISYYIASSISSIYLSGDAFHSEEQKNILVYATLSLFAINSFAAIIYKVLYAENRGWIANIYISLGWLLGLVFVVVYTQLDFQMTVLWAIFLFYFPSTIIPVFVLLIKLSELKVKISLTETFSIFKKIMSRGIGFWVFAIMSTLALQADYIVMSQRLNSIEITKYAITMKIFGISTLLYQAILHALWPVCAELRAKGKWHELGTIINRYLFFAIILIVIFSISIIIYKDMIFSLFSSDIEVPIITLLLFGIYFIVRVWTDTYAVLLQSMNIIRPFFILVPIQALLSINLQWYLSGIYGLNGILIGLTYRF